MNAPQGHLHLDMYLFPVAVRWRYFYPYLSKYLIIYAIGNKGKGVGWIKFSDWIRIKRKGVGLTVEQLSPPDSKRAQQQQRALDQ